MMSNQNPPLHKHKGVHYINGDFSVIYNNKKRYMMKIILRNLKKILIN
jgi:hypothetical protein